MTDHLSRCRWALVEPEIERLLGNAGIVRSRATNGNARVYLEMGRGGGVLAFCLEGGW